MILDIIKYGDLDSIKLRKKNIDANKDNPFLQQLIIDMFETLEYNKGVGLAAPQVGHNLNLFVINSFGIKEVFINPEIQLNGLMLQTRESCLSFPNMIFPVDRREIVEIKYYDKNWTLRLSKFSDMLATIVQHEYDHLHGKLICD
ncbi:peptide deformylase [Candidatus Dojkabacteria bacterium]|jgi:peptide deformylase|nr:peptide deformylase [Candidatus Dojkabacteria bacterium]